jgi:hypothetical protein
LRELVATTVKNKPVIALVDFEASRGGLSLVQVMRQLVEVDSSFEMWGFDASTPRGSELYSHLFLHEPVEWNRECRNGR